MPSDNLEARLLRRDAQLPAEEPISRWIAEPDDDSLELRERNQALLMEDGLVEYHVLADGRVEVRDYRYPRLMRSQSARAHARPLPRPSVAPVTRTTLPTPFRAALAITTSAQLPSAPS
jgi:hypothetical protein